LPDTTKALIKLPGIGLYTAGAIASIAYDLDEPVLDGNVTRVLCRLFAIKEDPKETGIQKKLWNLASKMILPGRAGLFNQALMDLGAMICLSQNPQCTACPLEEVCKACLQNLQELLPKKGVRKPIPHKTIVAGIIWKKDNILIDQRPPKGLLGGLWEFPGGKKEKRETLKEALIREIREEVGIEIQVDRRLIVVKHAYSHFKITLHAFECTYLSGRAKPIGCKALKWVKLEELNRYAFPAANHKVLMALRERAKNSTTKKMKRTKPLSMIEGGGDS